MSSLHGSPPASSEWHMMVLLSACRELQVKASRRQQGVIQALQGEAVAHAQSWSTERQQQGVTPGASTEASGYGARPAKFLTPLKAGLQAEAQPWHSPAQHQCWRAGHMTYNVAARAQRGSVTSAHAKAIRWHCTGS